MVPRQPIAQAIRQTQHPLPYGNIGEDVIDEVRSALGHPATATTRAEAASFARKGHEPIEAAGPALKPREPTGERPAPEEVAELCLDEPEQALALAQPRALRAERLEVLVHDPVERASGRAPRLVRRGR